MHAYCITTQYFIHLVCFEMFSKLIRAITIEWLDAVYGGHGKVHLQSYVTLAL